LKYIEEKWPIFKEEPHNVRISLEANGVNPFGELHSMYSVWHVFVIKNNVPRMSIKREQTMLAMIVLSIYLPFFSLKYDKIFHFFVSCMVIMYFVYKDI
jgi:hypothetical protein